MNAALFSFRAVLLIAAVACARTAVAQVSLTGTSYSQDFNSYAGSAVTVPTGWTVSFTGTPTYSGTGTGSSSTGGAWAYGSSGDFSLGVLRSTTPGNISLATNFTNNTGSTITALSFTWSYEQYRFANTSGLSLVGTGALSSASSLSSYGFTGSATGTTGSGVQTPISVTLSSLNITAGSSFGLRWTTTDASGADNGIAIDNFAVTAVPEPSTYAAMAGAVALLGVIVHRRRQRVAAKV